MSPSGRGKSGGFYRVAVALCAALLAVTLSEAPAAAKPICCRCTTGPRSTSVADGRVGRQRDTGCSHDHRRWSRTGVAGSERCSQARLHGAAPAVCAVPGRQHHQVDGRPVVLQLVSEGTLSLDDSVERWLPGMVPGGRIYLGAPAAEPHQRHIQLRRRSAGSSPIWRAIPGGTNRPRVWSPSRPHIRQCSRRVRAGRIRTPTTFWPG